MGVSDTGNARDLLGGGGGGGDLCVCDRERKGGAARERKCSVCVNVFACNWMRNCQWIDCYYVARVGRKDTIII